MNINISVLRILQSLSKNDRENSGKQSVVLPVFRLLGCFLAILLCSLSRNAFFSYTLMAMIFVRLALLDAKRLKEICLHIFPVVLLTILILFPSCFLGNAKTMITVTMKVFISISLILLLNDSVSWKELTDSLQKLHVPSVVILTLDMTVFFLIILGKFSNAVVEAAQLRSVGKISWKDSQLDGILGTTFLKSNQMANKTSEAMQCRGYNGIYKTYEEAKISFWDILYLGILILCVVYYFYLEMHI